MNRADVVGIVGAGTFGTALGVALGRAGRRVVLYTQSAAVANAIRTTRRCPRLPDTELPAAVTVVTDPRELATAARLLVVAVASTDASRRLAELGAAIDGSHLVVHAIGALADDDQRVSILIERMTPALRIGVLAGPALPGDLAAGSFGSMVVASTYDEVVRETRRLLNVPPVLRVYGSHDLIGVELASALAGAYTIALGIADGLAVAAGPRAVLITRAISEASRLGEALGGEARTFAGLSGLGNVLVRSGEPADRDYQLGRSLARGELTTRDTFTEGARAALAGIRLAARKGVRMPLLGGLAEVLRGTITVRDAAVIAADTVAAEE